MDITPAVLIFHTNIFTGCYGIRSVDPIHFGIILIMNLSIGLVTPPVGTVLFVGASIAKAKDRRSFSDLCYHITLAMIVVLVDYYIQ